MLLFVLLFVHTLAVQPTTIAMDTTAAFMTPEFSRQVQTIRSLAERDQAQAYTKAEELLRQTDQADNAYQLSTALNIWSNIAINQSKFDEARAGLQRALSV